ncbi:uncharacterized protein DEA37_0004905 [Paragonimus westermani]|uniref:Transmembrane protein 26 n=1 Tax=Paragonimus westermani TaxID=34504 RepID=A0A5J4P4Q5_9TREM|nr:uncharacterized protein DEA37_0004905 [Paragonimus westermani]
MQLKTIDSTARDSSSHNEKHTLMFGEINGSQSKPPGDLYLIDLNCAQPETKDLSDKSTANDRRPISSDYVENGLFYRDHIRTSACDSSLGRFTGDQNIPYSTSCSSHSRTVRLSDAKTPDINLSSADQHSVSSLTTDAVGTIPGLWFVRCCGKVCMQSWLAMVSLLVALRAIIVRMGFICFTCTAIVTVVTEKKDSRFWLLCITTMPLLIDLVLAIKAQVERGKNGSAISKWFSLCNFAYLICACPPIWIIELHHMDQLNNATTALKMQQGLLNQTIATTTTPSWLPSLQRSLPGNESMMIMGEEIEDYILAHEMLASAESSTRSRRVRRQITQLELVKCAEAEIPLHASCAARTLSVHVASLSNQLANQHWPAEQKGPTGTPPGLIPSGLHWICGVLVELQVVKRKPVAVIDERRRPLASALQLKHITLTQRIRILEQLLLLSVIVGRWLMPREGLSRDQLSQLLLINIGTAADILELFEAFSEEEVRQNDLLRAVILCLWQASLLQFCFNKTAIRERVVNNALPSTGGSRSSVNSVDHPQPVQATHIQLEALTSDEIKPKKKRLKSQCCGQQPSNQVANQHWPAEQKGPTGTPPGLIPSGLHWICGVLVELQLVQRKPIAVLDERRRPLAPVTVTG